MEVTEVTRLIESIIEPDFGQSLKRLQSISSVEIQGDSVVVYLSIVQPVHYVAQRLHHHIVSTIHAHFPNAEVTVLVQECGQPTSARAAAIAGVQNLIAVASGKGGVGKSTVTANLAAAMAQRGLKVGILDADIYGPSQPTMFGLAGESMRAEKTDDGKILGYPNEQYGVKVASIGFVMQRDQAAILRGPMLAGYFTTLVEQMQWGELDVLLFDLPPGTGDIQLTLTQRIPLTGAVVVTTPQEIALADVRRSIQMFRKVNVNVLGVVENMSYFIPPDAPDKRYHIFGQGGGASISAEYDVPFLGELPIDSRIRQGADDGFPFVVDPESGSLADAFRDVAQRVIQQIRIANHSAAAAPVSIEL
jgi:ATP-binding protein involved in chromosome partitioning